MTAPGDEPRGEPRDKTRPGPPRGIRAVARATWKRLRGGEITPARVGLSVAVGIAVGVTPLYGLHWILLLAICLPFRLDAGIAWLASNVSLPFIAPFLVFAELQVGARVLEGAWRTVTMEEIRAFRPADLAGMVGELVVGTLVVAPAAAIAGGTLAWAVTRFVQRRRARAT